MPATAEPPVKKNKFKLLAGVHVEDGRKYEAGDIVASADDLAKRFTNKFSLVDPATPATNRKVTFTPHANVPPQPGIPGQPPYIPGDQPRPQGVDDAADTENANKGPAGAEVTSKFPKAVEEDYKVFKQGGKYFVYNADHLDKPVNEKGVGKADVDAVIDEALEAE